MGRGRGGSGAIPGQKRMPPAQYMVAIQHIVHEPIKHTAYGRDN